MVKKSIGINSEKKHNKLLHADSVSCRVFCIKTQKIAPTYSAGEQGVIRTPTNKVSLNMRLILLLLLLISEVSMSFENNFEYFTLRGEENNNPITYRGIKSPLDSKEQNPHLVIINWSYDGNDKGLPSKEIYDEQNIFEDALDTIEVAGVGIVSLVIFGDNRKDWFVYVADYDKFMIQFNNTFQNHPQYPISIQPQLEDNWEFHSGFIQWANVK